MLQSVLRRNDVETAMYTDAVSKLRVCTPESLIDTDFEYSLHHSKWETLHMVNNIPCCYSSSINLDVQRFDYKDGTLYVQTVIPHSMIKGSPVILSGTMSCLDGTYWVLAVPTNTSFVVRMDSSKRLTSTQGHQWSPAYLYQSSMFAAKDILSMEWVSSTRVKVTTAAPHGFLPGSRMAVKNTSASRVLTFEGSQVIPALPSPQLTVVTVDTTVNRLDAYGYNWKNVNPYDWTASKTTFFVNNQVNLYFSGFNIPNHGYATGDYVMYVPPIGDAIVGGMQAYDVYQVKVVDDNNFYVNEVMSSRAAGFHYKTFGGAMAGAETPLNTGVATMIDQSNNDKLTYEYVGWFKPTSTGTWRFALQGGNGAFWLGPAALTSLASDTGVTNASMLMQQGVYYPVRIHSQGTSIRFEFQGPDDTLANTVGNNVFFHDTHDIKVSEFKVMLTDTGTSSFGPHAFMKVHLVQSMNPQSNTFTLTSPLNEVRGTPVTFFSKGFGIDRVTLSKSNVSTRQYLKYYVEDDGSRFTVSPYGALVDVVLPYAHGVTWIVPLRINPEYDTISSVNHGLNTGDVVVYEVISGEGPAGLENSTSYVVDKVSEDVFRLKPDSYSSSLDICSTGHGVIRFTCSVDQTMLANTIYIPNHQLYDGAQCKLNNQTYWVIRATQDRFALTSQLGSVAAIITPPTTTGTYTLVYSDQEADGTYIVTTVADANTMDVESPMPMSRSIVAIKSVVLHPDYPQGLLYAPQHMLPGQCKMTYLKGTTELGGLVENSVYNMQRIDDAFLKCVSITITNATGTNHRMMSSDIRGERVLGNAASIQQGSKEIAFNGLVARGLWKTGDTITVIIPGVNTSFMISTRDGSSGVITLTTNHGLSDGDFVFCQEVVYYVKVMGSNQIALYTTYNDAQQDSSRIVPFTANGPIIRRVPGQIFCTIVEFFRGDGVCVVQDPAPVTSTVNIAISTTMHPVTDGNVLHRPGDSGVEIMPPLNPHGQVIRQTRKYIKYQSGKGIQLSNAVNFSGHHPVLSLTRKGTIAYIKTLQAHKLIPGTVFKVHGAIDEDWNGEYAVQQVIDAFTFTFKLTSLPEATLAVGTLVTYTLEAWTNVRLRIGMFDEQNGMFWEYDGAKLWVVKRNSVSLIPGTCRATRGSSLILADDGMPAKYTLSLVPGDMIVLRGMSYKVVSIVNDTTFYIQPPYYGASANGISIRRTQDTRVQQSKWSLDPCDGTGLTGFDLDIHKTQMFYIDYSWYGAGKVRYGVKASSGEVRYVHEFIHNNIVTEAYVRTGNLPVRYEVCNSGAPSALPALTHWGTSVIMDGGYTPDRSYAFSASSCHLNWFGGSAVIVPLASDHSVETWPGLVFDTSKQSWGPAWKVKVSVFADISGMLPGTPITGEGIAAGTYTIGSSFAATDGGASGYMLINKAPVSALGTTIQVGGDTNVVPSYIPIMSLRLCPSIRSGNQAPLGEGEVINRIQLCLRKITVSNTHHCDMLLLLNPMSVSTSASWQAADRPSFAQVLRHAREDRIALDGIVLQRFYVAPGNTTVTRGLEDLIPLGNSINAGENIFPDGPDVVTIVAFVRDANNVMLHRPFSVSAQMEWSESESV